MTCPGCLVPFSGRSPRPPARRTYIERSGRRHGTWLKGFGSMRYDVYVLPGGACIPKILQKNGYEDVVGVACCEELKLAVKYLENSGVTGQGMPLIRNGCANTEFSINSLEAIL